MKDTQVNEASKLLRRRLQEVMKQQGLTSQEALAKHLDITVSTIGRYFWPHSQTLPTPDTLKKLRDKIPTLTDDDVRILELAYSRRASLARSLAAKRRRGKNQPRKGKDTSPSTSRTDIPEQVSCDDTDIKLGRLMRQLLTEVVQKDNVQTKAPNPITLLTSNAEHRYQVGDMPAVLTKDNFRTLEVSKWSEKEQQQFLDYANLVLEESRKCLLLLAQFEPEEIRDDLLERLARNADLLWRTYKAASSVAPIQYVRDIDLALRNEKF